MIDEDKISKANACVASILDPSHLMSIVILYLNEHVVYVAIAAPKQGKTVAIIDNNIKTKTHSKCV